MRTHTRTPNARGGLATLTSYTGVACTGCSQFRRLHYTCCTSVASVGYTTSHNTPLILGLGDYGYQLYYGGAGHDEAWLRTHEKKILA